LCAILKDVDGVVGSKKPATRLAEKAEIKINNLKRNEEDAILDMS
jgi:hypothetical protein